MKLRAFSTIIIILLGLLIVSCNDDDDSNSFETINGAWNLKSVNGGLVGISIDYALGEVIWIFNETTGKLIVENNILTTGPEDIYAGLDSGTYNYNLQVIDDVEFLFVNDSEMGPIVISGNILEIGYSPAADGVISKFIR